MKITIILVSLAVVLGCCSSPQPQSDSCASHAILKPKTAPRAKLDEKTKQKLVELENRIQDVLLAILHLEYHRDTLMAEVAREPDVFTKAQREAFPDPPRHFDLQEYLEQRQELLSSLNRRLEELKKQFYMPNKVREKQTSEP